MLSVSEALERILAEVRPQPLQFTDLRNAPGRILAGPIEAPRPAPPFDNSAMDGFAVRAADLAHATPESPVTLDLAGAPWRDAMEVLAWKTGCVVWDAGNGSVTLRRLPKMTMEFHQADVKIVLELVARNSGITLVMGEGLGGSCGMNVRDVAWRDLLYTMSRKHPFHIEATAPGVFSLTPLPAAK